MIKLYSNECPKCIQLKSKFDERKINYEYVKLTNEEAVLKGFKSMPMVQFEDGKIKNFVEAIQIIRLVA